MMFGHNNDDQQNNTATATMPPAPVPDEVLTHPEGAAEENNTVSPQPAASTTDGFLPAPNEPVASDDSPAADNTAGDDSDVKDDVAVTASSAPANNDDLLSLKQNALHQLSPLLDHLDQTPEEKFRTTMMMIQATDNQDLLKSAYEAAQAITEEKARAQALLDVVNEINYFTQHPTA